MSNNDIQIGRRGQNTKKPKGLAKIWQEIKKPFKHGWRSLYYQIVYCMYALFLPEGVSKDYWFLKGTYWQHFNRDLSFKNPQTYTEKLQWLKLYDRNPSHTLKADKYAVREFIKNTIGEEHLVKLYGVYEHAEDIDFDVLPDQFVLKANHGSSWNIICPDKNLLDRKKTIETLNKWLKKTYGRNKREWIYTNIPHRIVCEEFLEANTEWGLLDYKIFCFNGKPEFVQVDFDRFGEHKRNFYDPQWKRLPLAMTYSNHAKDAPPPPCLDEMLRLASLLAKNIFHVRVDFYHHHERIIFGEMTFYPEGGHQKFDPAEIDYQWGKLLKLPFELDKQCGN